MKNQRTRDFMTRLYRLIEKWEDTPKCNWLDETEEYFRNVGNDCAELLDEFRENEFATELTIAFYDALSQRFQKINPNALEERQNKRGGKCK